VDLISIKSNLTISGTETILSLVAMINKQRSFTEKFNYLSANPPVVNPEYIQGFTDGEGHFAVEIHKPQAGRTVPTIACSLQITQASHDVSLLSAILEYFGGTRIKPTFDITSLSEAQVIKPVSRLWVNQVITKSRSGVPWNRSPIILLFDRLPLLTLKQLDYLDWKSILELAANRAHHNKEGLTQIQKLKAGMNQGRIKISINDLP